MILDYETLKLIWWLFVGVLLVGFAITDGMDMGVGALLPFVARNDDERRVVINTVGPHWDGNQVWLITAGGAIFAAWPPVYAAAFSGFYWAMLLVLFALFFRPVGFEYRSKIAAPRWRNTWDWALFAGSTIPALVFGVAFGNLFQGVPFQLDEFLRPSYAGSFFALLNPYALLAGVVSVAMLVMHGGVWLQMRAEEPIAGRAALAARAAALVLVVAFALAGIWLAFGVEGFRVVEMGDPGGQANPLGKVVEIAAGAWFDNYGALAWTAAAPILAFAATGLTVWLSMANRPGAAFFTSSLAVAGVIFTAGFSLFPFIMPSTLDPASSLTVWDATSSHLTLKVMFWAVVVFLPLVLAYTVWSYSRMWGRVTVADIQSRAQSAY